MGGHTVYENKLLALIDDRYRIKLRINKVRRSFRVSDTPKQRRNKSINLRQLTILMKHTENQLDVLQRGDNSEKTLNQLSHRESAPTTPNIPIL